VTVIRKGGELGASQTIKGKSWEERLQKEVTNDRALLAQAEANPGEIRNVEAVMR